MFDRQCVCGMALAREGRNYTTLYTRNFCLSQILPLHTPVYYSHWKPQLNIPIHKQIYEDSLGEMRVDWYHGGNTVTIKETIIIMSSDNINKNLDISGALSSLNIGSSNNESACGKECGDSMNSCNKCDLAKYCNAACKKKHRSRHKKKCEIRAAELYDGGLFKEPPPPE